VLLLSQIVGRAAAQSSLGGPLPSALKPGSPAGSYESSMDTINLFNGHLNFRMPLITIGGRGDAGLPLVFALNPQWGVVKEFTPGVPARYYPSYGGGEIEDGPGSDTIDFGSPLGFFRLSVIQAGSRNFSVDRCPGQGFVPIETLTIVRFLGQDGTTYELRDKLTNGEPNSTSCTPFNRGRVFVTADGTSATYIADTDVFDSLNGVTPLNFPSGYFLLRDGTRFRIDEYGRCVWMRDRNGNKMSFSYSSDGVTRLTGITDSLGRQVSINHIYINGKIVERKIDFKGFGAAPRTIRIQYTNLGNALRSGYFLRTEKDLFPQLNGSSSQLQDRQVVSSITLPNSLQYKFYYNSYAELARVELPAGSAIEYDYAPGLTDGPESGYLYLGVAGGHHIYRRVAERRVYPDGGSGGSFAIRMTYSRPESSASNAGFIQTDQYDSTGAVLGSQLHYFYGSARASFGKEPTRYSPWQEGLEYQMEDLAADRVTVLRRLTHTWSQPVAGSHWPLTQEETQANAKPNDPQITQTVTTMFDVTPNLVSKQTFGYDQYNNRTDVYKYDFGEGAPGPLISRTHTDYVTLNNGVDYASGTNIHLRNLPRQMQVFDAGEIKRAETFYEYDLYDNSPNHAPLIDRQGISGLDSGFTTGFTTRGNVTRTSRALLNNSGGVTGWVNSHAQYDIAGNVVKAIDANGNPTQFDFRDNFGSPDDPAVQSSDNPANNAPGELGGQISYAFPFKITNALGHKAYTKYDYYLGTAALSEDANGVKSSVYFNDALDRPTRGVSAIGTSAASQTVFVYNDSDSPVNGYPAHSITTVSDKDVFGESNSGNGLKSVALYDGLGRTWRGAAYEGSTCTIKDTQFDAFGRVSQVSNPYRADDPGSASPPPGLWTTTEYDVLGRVIKVTTPDGARVDTVYSGAQVTVTDQAGKKRRSKTDALGRLAQIIEDPDGVAYQTNYSYDTLGNLIVVNQGGQFRYFFHDSLGRLTRAKNPEQSANSSLNLTDPPAYNNNWSLAYSYYANGNLFSKTDARNITTTYDYDELNRNKTVTYSDSTPGITRTYDTATLGKGRLQKTETAGSMGTRVTINEYDAMGRPKSQSQQFFYLGAWGTSYTTQQTYDLAGNVKTLKYPSDHAVNYTYDQAGRLSSFTGNLGGAAIDYATGIQYDSFGLKSRETYGTQTPLYLKQHYNSRMQLVDLRLSSINDEFNWNRGALTFYYGPNGLETENPLANNSKNNGNVWAAWHYAPKDDAISANSVPMRHYYYYDALNRIAAVRERQRGENGQWADSVSQAFGYDPWGNRTLDLSGEGGKQEEVWMDDALPAGAVPIADWGDSWNWVSSSPDPKSGSVSHISNIADWSNWSPAPYSGSVSHQSSISSGMHQHYFLASPTNVPVRSGGTLYAYIYIDPENIPQEVMLQWGTPTDGWEHRAYWGANVLGWGTYGTSSRRYMGPLPQAGGWVRLEVPASAVGLEGLNVNAMAFSLYGGRANWDLAGISGVHVWYTERCFWNGMDFNCIEIEHQENENNVLVDDSIPAGAASGADGGDSWNWRGANNVDMVHQHYFYNASDTLQVSAGDKLFTWVYLDTAYTPREVMLQWCSNESGWGHRAYWGANNIPWGTDGTADRKYIGPLPAAGGWVRLEIPASAVGLEGKIVNGMAFTLYGGRAAWDRAGKVTFPLVGAGPPINNRVYTVDAATNRLTSVNGVVMSYDAAGNQTNEGSGERIYDGENRLMEAKNSAGVTVSRYVYDAGGRRVRRIIGGQETWQVYGLGGGLLAEYGVGASPSAAQKEYGYRGGQLLVVWDGSETGDRQLQWLVQDHLGSTRMVVDRSGSLGGIRRHDFAPFGEELPARVGIRSEINGYSGDSVRQKYTSKERDNETNLDYFLARYCSGTQGRFTSVDPGNTGAMLDAPQSWNGYTYVLNSPLVYTDPSGKCPTCPDNVYVNLADAAYTINEGASIGGWKAVRVYEPGYGYRGVVFQGAYKGNTEYIYATAGTGATDSTWDLVADLINDGEQLVGLSEQYAETVPIAKALTEKLPGISFTGHSLGGGLAAANALAVNGKAITFNAAGVTIFSKSNLGLLGKRALINAYIVNGEIVDRLQLEKADGTRIYMGNKLPWSQAFSAHGMESVKKAFDQYYFWRQINKLQWNILMDGSNGNKCGQNGNPPCVKLGVESEK
jgi:RHS repeat-associated protein